MAAEGGIFAEMNRLDPSSRRRVFVGAGKLNPDATFLPPDDVARIDFFWGKTINVNWSGMPTCDPMSSAAPPSDTLRRTHPIEMSPNMIKPLSRAGRRWVFRASCKSMIFIWAPGWVRERLSALEC